MPFLVIVDNRVNHMLQKFVVDAYVVFECKCGNVFGRVRPRSVLLEPL